MDRCRACGTVTSAPVCPACGYVLTAADAPGPTPREEHLIPWMGEPTGEQQPVPPASAPDPYAVPAQAPPAWVPPTGGRGIGHPPPGQPPRSSRAAPRRAQSGGGVSGGVLAAVAVVLVASVAGLFLLWKGLLFQGQAADPAPQQGAVPTATPPAPSPTTPAAPSTPPTRTSSSSAPVVTLPEASKRCGSGGGWTSYSGHERTTCEFAEAVRVAFIDAGGKVPATIDARSPVTKQDYTLTCRGGVVVTCRTTTKAIVHLVPENARVK